MAAAVTSCLAACGAAGALRELHVGLWTPQGSPDSWLPSLTSLTCLRLGTMGHPLQLPHAVSRLALLDAELSGCPLQLGHTRLPPSLTGLCLRDMASTALPHQVGGRGAPAGGCSRLGEGMPPPPATATLPAPTMQPRLTSPLVPSRPPASRPALPRSCPS